MPPRSPLVLFPLSLLTNVAVRKFLWLRNDPASTKTLVREHSSRLVLRVVFHELCHVFHEYRVLQIKERIYLLSIIQEGGGGIRIGVSQSSKRPPPTTEVVGSIPACIEHLIARGKSSSTLCRKSWVFSAFSGFLPQGMLTGWVRMRVL